MILLARSLFSHISTHSRIVCKANFSPLPMYSEVSSGGRYTLSSGRAEVSLTLDSSVRGDSGDWTCSAQVFESGTTLTVGGPVERTLQLVVVGEWTTYPAFMTSHNAFQLLYT